MSGEWNRNMALQLLHVENPKCPGCDDLLRCGADVETHWRKGHIKESDLMSRFAVARTNGSRLAKTLNDFFNRGYKVISVDMVLGIDRDAKRDDPIYFAVFERVTDRG